MSAYELKRCPFCGTYPKVTTHSPKIDGKYQFQIGCEEDLCFFSPTAHGFETMEIATKVWNTRDDKKVDEDYPPEMVGQAWETYNKLKAEGKIK